MAGTSLSKVAKTILARLTQTIKTNFPVPLRAVKTARLGSLARLRDERCAEHESRFKQDQNNSALQTLSSQLETFVKQNSSD
jgi:hypothetical protein